jgi:hypothetical protein
MLEFWISVRVGHNHPLPAPHPPHRGHRGAISLILRLLLWSELFSLCVHFACKCVIVSVLRRLLVRVPYYRVLCVSCVCDFWGLWLYV